MDKIYFFQVRNKDGSLSDRIINCGEQVAWRRYNNMKTNNLVYLGWSDGSVITGVRNQIFLRKDEKTGIAKEFSIEQKETIRSATKQEIQNAKDTAYAIFEKDPKLDAHPSLKSLVTGAKSIHLE